MDWLSRIGTWLSDHEAMISSPGLLFRSQLYLAAIYGELGRQSEARSAVDQLLRLWPRVTTEKWAEEMRKSNYRDDTIRHWVAALRKAGLPE